MKNKQRADQLLVNLGFYPSREKAKRSILAGLVSAEKYPKLKPGQLVALDTQFHIKERERFVSRGGYKLDGAIVAFDLCLDGMVALDIGSSTGGFTDCLLQCGVSKVYAVDVGKGLIDWRLRNDSRVILIEEKNARYLTQQDLPEQVDVITVDVSFISLKKIVPAALSLLKDNGYILTLVKPQFEAGKGQVGKNGVVKDEKLISTILQDMIEFFISIGLVLRGQVRSSIRGPAGNKEYILWAAKPLRT